MANEEEVEKRDKIESQKSESIEVSKLLRAKTKINLIDPETKDDSIVGFKDFKDFASFSYGCCGLIVLFMCFTL